MSSANANLPLDNSQPTGILNKAQLMQDTPETVTQDPNALEPRKRRVLNLSEMTLLQVCRGAILGGFFVAVLLSSLLAAVYTLTASSHITIGYILVIAPYRGFNFDLSLLFGFLKLGLVGGLVVGIVAGMCLWVFLFALALAYRRHQGPIKEEIKPAFKRFCVRAGKSKQWIFQLSVLAGSTGLVPLGLVSWRWMFESELVGPEVSEHIMFAVCAGFVGWLAMSAKKLISPSTKQSVELADTSDIETGPMDTSKS